LAAAHLELPSVIGFFFIVAMSAILLPKSRSVNPPICHSRFTVSQHDLEIPDDKPAA